MLRPYCFRLLSMTTADLLLEPVTEALGEISPFRVRIETSPLGDEAVVLGAVWMALQAAQELLFTRTASS